MTNLTEFSRCGAIALDFETFDLDENDMFSEKKEKYTIDIFSVAGKYKDIIISGVFRAEDFTEFWRRYNHKRFIFHNAKYDLKCIKRAGYAIDEILIEDTMIMSHLLDETRPKGLKELRVSVLGKDKREAYKEINRNNEKEYFTYAELDAIDTYELYERFYPQIKKEGLEVVYELEKQCVFPTLEMEYYGVKLDTSLLLKQRDLLTKLITPLKEEFDLKYRFDINSPVQISNYIFNNIGYKPLRKWENRDTGNISVDKSTLKYIAEDNSNIEARNLAKNILEYRKYNTLFTTFNEGLLNSLNNGRIYCNFHGQGTRTSRFASSNPNLQNQPKLPFIKDDYDSSLRALYIPNEGDVLCGADFSQIELRMMAELSRDPSMVKVYLEDLDLHRMTADLVGCIRDAAKIINFGIGYGYTAIGLMEGINDKVEEEHKVDEFKAQELINRFWGAYPKVKALFDYVDKSLYETHYVRDIIGRKRRWGIISNSSLREAHNYLIQASAGELMKMAMVDLYKKKDHKRSQFLLTVHDELVVSAHPSYIDEFKELMTDCMINVIKTTVPLKISLKIGKNWAECK